jgi:hypothetical protein
MNRITIIKEFKETLASKKLLLPYIKAFNASAAWRLDQSIARPNSINSLYHFLRKSSPDRFVDEAFHWLDWEDDDSSCCWESVNDAWFRKLNDIGWSDYEDEDEEGDYGYSE